MKTQDYLAFLALHQSMELPAEPSTMRVLEHIAARWQIKPLTVTGLLNTTTLGAPATIHRKLNDLREAGLVADQYEGRNRRTKNLIPTPKALRHFQTVASLLAIATQEL